jgi:uncharacterized protein HemX
MQQEVQKALKIHKANKELNQKNTLMKQLLDKATAEQKVALDAKDQEISAKQRQIENLQSEVLELRQINASRVQDDLRS